MLKKLINRFQSQKGMAVLKVLLGFVLAIVIMATAIPVVWPMIASSGTDIAAMTQTDAGTTFIQGMWPVLIAVSGILVMGVLIFVLVKKAKTG